MSCALHHAAQPRHSRVDERMPRPQLIPNCPCCGCTDESTLSNAEMRDAVRRLKAELARVNAENSRLKEAAAATPRRLSQLPTSPPPTKEFNVEEMTEKIIADIEGRSGFVSIADTLNFDYKSYVRRILHQVQGFDGITPPPIICGGYTQSKKTGFKAVLALIGHYVDATTVVVTKGVPESISLAEKIKGILDGRPIAELVKSQSVRRHHDDIKRPRRTDMSEVMVKNGCIVSAHHGHQLYNDLQALEQSRGKGFGGWQHAFLAFDEADDYERSPEDDQKHNLQLERGLADLWDKGIPLLVVAATATMMPLLSNPRYQSITGHDFFMTYTTGYYGVEDFESFRNDSGEMVVIPPGTLSNKNLNLCSEMLEFYRAAATTPKALLLDITTPWVTAKGNNFERSVKIRKHLRDGIHRDVVFVVVTGQHIKVLKPDDEVFTDEFLVRDKEIGDVLKELDSKLADIPIFVLGYSKMERGMSFRSDGRVVTHMVVNLGATLSYERLGQTWGRATGMDFPAGHKVVVLTTGTDWDSLRAYLRFQQKLIQLMRGDRYNGFTLKRILEEHTFDDEENFWSFSKRTVAQKRAKRSSTFAIKNRGPLDLWGEHRQGLQATLRGLPDDQQYINELILVFFNDPGTLHTVADLQKKVAAKLESDPVDEDQLDVHQTRPRPVSRTFLKRALKELVKAKIVDKDKSDKYWFNDVDSRST